MFAAYTYAFGILRQKNERGSVAANRQWASQIKAYTVELTDETDRTAPRRPLIYTLVHTAEINRKSLVFVDEMFSLKGKGLQTSRRVMTGKGVNCGWSWRRFARVT